MATAQGKMGTMDIEQLAVNKISDMIAHCPRLVSYIAKNDKTPLTDGHIDIHASDRRPQNANFRGRVPVQVKGRSASAKRQQSRSFAIARSSLEAYLKDSGVLYFVVYVDPISGKRAPYYAILNPFKIAEILQGNSPKASFPVQLQPFPREPSKIERILDLAYQTRSENPDVGMDPSLLSRVQEITLYTDGTINIYEPVTLRRDERDFSVVVKTSGGMRFPVDGVFTITPADYIGEPANITLRNGDFEFQNPTRRRISPDTVELELSEGLKFRLQLSDTGISGNFAMNLQDSLAGRFKDIGFFLSCTDSASFWIDGREVQFDVSGVVGSDELRSHFQYLQKLKELFEGLSVDVGLISLETITEAQGKQLVHLHRALIEGQEVSQDFDRPGRVLQPVGIWGIELLCVRGRQPGQWRYQGLFDPDLDQQFAAKAEGEDSQFFLLTPYDLIDDERLPYTLNLRLGSVVGAYEKVSDYPEIPAYANRLVLRLIKAADEVSMRRAEFLHAANDLNNWLISQEGETPFHLINKWQIAVRNDGLTPDERKAIRALKRTSARDGSEYSALVEAACAILLGDVEDIEDCLLQLEGEELEQLRSWPVWTLRVTHEVR